MELLFLWIEDFRNIKRQGFDFSAEFKFQVIVDEEQLEDSKKYKLIISENERYVNLFNENVISVTGIVGKNGAGKSTLLHFLKIMTGNLSKLDCPLIFCLRKNNSKEINTYYHNYGAHIDIRNPVISLETDKQINIKYNFNKPIGYEIDTYGFKKDIIYGLDFEFSEIATCYFSNTFDSHREDIYDGVYNISTNYKLEKFLNDYISSNKGIIKTKKQKKAKIELWPHLQQYHKSELNVLIKFLSYANTKGSGDLLFLPKMLIINFNFGDYEYLIDNKNYNLIDLIGGVEKIHKKALRIIRKSNDRKKNFMNMITLTSFYHILRKSFSTIKGSSKDIIYKRIKEIADSSNEQIDLFDRIKKILNVLSKVKDTNLGNQTISELLSNSFEEVILKIQFLDNETVSDNIDQYLLKIEDNIWKVLSLIFDLQAFEDTTYMEYAWFGGLSTGQEAFLKHFSRLFELKDKVENKTVLLLIDEGDLYFHPEWQKKYFSELITYLELIFPYNKFQIILTTHSPFIASDLPRQNLIFLKQDADGNCQVLNNDTHIETFGSNIHELFTQTFFLSDSLMGEFARVKIAELIKELDTINQISHEQYETNYKNRIEIIGESFIKSKLFELVARKSENRVIDSIIDQRNNEIERLKQIKNRRNNDQN